jgi:hypothetical protein
MARYNGQPGTAPAAALPAQASEAVHSSAAALGRFIIFSIALQDHPRADENCMTPSLWQASRTIKHRREGTWFEIER